MPREFSHPKDRGDKEIDENNEGLAPQSIREFELATARLWEETGTNDDRIFVDYYGEVHIERGRIYETADGQRRESMTYPLSDPDQILIRDIVYKKTDNQEGSEFTPGKVFMLFANRAESQHELEYFTEYLKEYTEQEATDGLEAQRMLDALLHRTLTLNIEQNPEEETEAISWREIFNQLADGLEGNRNAEQLRNRQSAILGRLFIGEESTEKTWRWKEIAAQNHELIDMVVEADALGLINERFWLDYAIYAGIGTRESVIGEMLHEKLLSDEAPAILADIPKEREYVPLDNYVNRYIAACRADEARDAKQLEGVLKLIGERQGISMAKTLQLADGLRRHRRGEKVTKPTEMIIDDFAFYGEALHEVMSLTRSLNPAENQRQAAFDRLHAEIITVLTARIPGNELTRRPLTVMDLVEMYPEASPEELIKLIDKAQTRNLPELYGRYRAQRAQRPKRRYGITKPGWGDIS